MARWWNTATRLASWFWKIFCGFVGTRGKTLKESVPPVLYRFSSHVSTVNAPYQMGSFSFESSSTPSLQGCCCCYCCCYCLICFFFAWFLSFLSVLLVVERKRKISNTSMAMLGSVDHFGLVPAFKQSISHRVLHQQLLKGRPFKVFDSRLFLWQPLQTLAVCV